MAIPADTKTCRKCGRTLPASDFQSGTLNVASDECTDCVWERMCTVREADSLSADNSLLGQRTPTAMNVDGLRHSYRRYRGDERYRILERLRSRLAAAAALDGRESLVRSETGLMFLAARSRWRRTRRHATGGWHGSEDIQGLYDDQAGRCFYCGIELGARYVVDHKTPLSRGGTDWPENLCCACEYCASRKGEQTEEEFRAHLARLRRHRP